MIPMSVWNTLDADRDLRGFDPASWSYDAQRQCILVDFGSPLAVWLALKGLLGQYQISGGIRVWAVD